MNVTKNATLAVVALVAIMALVPASAGALELPVTIWSGSVTPARAAELVDEMNSTILVANGVLWTAVLEGVKPPVEGGCDDLRQLGGINIAEVPLASLPQGVLETASTNQLPFNMASRFCGEIANGFLGVDPPSPYPANGSVLILGHAILHMMGLVDHVPGTVMNSSLQGMTAYLSPSQVATLNEAGPQSTQAPAGTAGSPGLLLGQGRRFRVQMTWVAQGEEESGVPVALTTDAGYFWFFRPTNLEVTVKVLDGCASNGHFWVSAAGMTNVQVDIVVTDTLTGREKRYHSPPGPLFKTVFDTAAFACSQ